MALSMARIYPTYKHMLRNWPLSRANPAVGFMSPYRARQACLDRRHVSARAVPRPSIAFVDRYSVAFLVQLPEGIRVGRGAGPTARGRRLQPGADPYRADGVDQGLHIGERVRCTRDARGDH